MSRSGKWKLMPLGKFGVNLLIGIAAAILLLALFVELSEDLLFHELGTFDTVVGQFVRSFSNVWLTDIAIGITYLGSAPTELILMIIIGAYLLFPLKHIWETVVLAINLAGAWLLNLVLKDLFHRARPNLPHLVEVSGYSFPSGHAMVSTAFYGMIGYLLWLNLRTKWKHSWLIIVFTVFLIFAIGTSRVYLGVHYPSDVAAGFAAGGVWMIACIIALHTIRYYKSNRKWR